MRRASHGQREFTLKMSFTSLAIRDRSVDWDERLRRERDTHLDDRELVRIRIRIRIRIHIHIGGLESSCVFGAGGEKSDVDAYMYIYPTSIGHSSAGSYCRQVAALRREITALAHTRPDSRQQPRHPTRLSLVPSRGPPVTYRETTEPPLTGSLTDSHARHDTRHTTHDTRNQFADQR